MPKQLNLTIGDIGFAVVRGQGRGSLGLAPEHKDFASQARPELVLTAHRVNPPRLEPLEPVFDSGGSWRLFSYNQQPVFCLYAAGNLSPYLLAILSPDLQRGEIFLQPRAQVNPLSYPLDELLAVYLLAQQRGALVHASAIDYKGRGFLFLGRSGSGKSTLANLCEDDRDITILSDDRIIVRYHHSRFWLYGTPWSGQGAQACNQKVVLEKIFFLNKGTRNYLRPLTAPDGATRLLVSSFPPFWCKKGIQFTTKLFCQLAQAVPSYQLDFLPDKTVVNFLKDEACGA